MLPLTRILLLDRTENRVLVFVKCIEGFFKPYSGSLIKMVTNDTSEDGILLTYGEDIEGQMVTSYLKLWKLGYIREGYDSISNHVIIQPP